MHLFCVMLYQRKVGKTLIFMILTKNASFRSYSTFAYLLRAHIRVSFLPHEKTRDIESVCARACVHIAN